MPQRPQLQHSNRYTAAEADWDLHPHTHHSHHRRASPSLHFGRFCHRKWLERQLDMHRLWPSHLYSNVHRLRRWFVFPFHCCHNSIYLPELCGRHLLHRLWLGHSRWLRELWSWTVFHSLCCYSCSHMSELRCGYLWQYHRLVCCKHLHTLCRGLVLHLHSSHGCRNVSDLCCRDLWHRLWLQHSKQLCSMHGWLLLHRFCCHCC